MKRFLFKTYNKIKIGEGNFADYERPKYRTQAVIFDRVKVVFENAILERKFLLNEQINHEKKDKIIIDLRIAMCIKKKQDLP